MSAHISARPHLPQNHSVKFILLFHSLLDAFVICLLLLDRHLRMTDALRNGNWHTSANLQLPEISISAIKPFRRFRVARVAQTSAMGKGNLP